MIELTPQMSSSLRTHDYMGHKMGKWRKESDCRILGHRRHKCCYHYCIHSLLDKLTRLP